MTPARAPAYTARMDRNKTVVAFAWVVCLVMMLGMTGTASIIGTVVFWAMALAHLAEFLAKRAVMAKAGGSMGHHFVQTMLFGLFHWKPLEDAQKQAGGGA